MRRCSAPRDKSGAAASRRSSRCSMRLHRELKAAFDPAGILNPGRMYRGALGLDAASSSALRPRRAPARRSALSGYRASSRAYSWIESAGSPASPAFAAASNSSFCCAERLGVGAAARRRASALAPASMACAMKLAKRSSAARLRSAQRCAPAPQPVHEPGDRGEQQRARSPASCEKYSGPCRPSSPTSSATRPKAGRPTPSCASACTAASAPRPARPTRCSATTSTARAAASISSSARSKARRSPRKTQPAPRPLPHLPRLRDHLPLGRAATAAWSTSAARWSRSARRAARGTGCSARLLAFGAAAHARSSRCAALGSCCGRAAARLAGKDPAARAGRRMAGAAPCAQDARARAAACSRRSRRRSTPPRRACSTGSASRSSRRRAPAAAARVRFHLNYQEAGRDDMRALIDAWWPLVERGESRRS